MPKDRQFINPLTQRSAPALPEVQRPEQDATSAPAPIGDTPPTRAKRKADSFERRNQRATHWIDRRLYQQFEALAYREGISKTALLNEAIADLLKKRGEKH